MLGTNPFKCLNKFEMALWIISVLTIFTATILSADFSIITLVASLIGVTSLIFVAKGNVYGQILGIIFSFMYAFVSWQFAYYGEMFTYLLMTTPMAVFSLISWLKNPYEDEETKEVKINYITKKQVLYVFLLATVVTFIFYFVLKAFNTTNLIVSTVSIFTSFFAASLSFLRSPYYALAYVSNDIVLIVLWIYASISEPQYYTMVACFLIFIINDIYGYLSWQKMKSRQNAGIEVTD